MHVTRYLRLFGAAAAVACSSAPVERTSSIEGTLTQTSFPSPATTVVAVNESGATIRAVVGADGSFRVALPKGHLYRLQVLCDSSGMSMVFPRADGRLDSTFRVRGGSARVRLGSVRYLAAATGMAFRVAPSQAPASECVNGVLQGTTTACVNDDGKVECAGATSNDGDNVQAESTDGPDENVSSEQAMAIPDQDVPDDVGGCAEEDDDDVQQEGEH